MHAQIKQYGINHYVTGITHLSMCDTLNRTATEISRNDPAFILWYKGQLVVVIIRTNKSENIIFFGDKTDTLMDLETFLQKYSELIIWNKYFI